MENEKTNMNYQHIKGWGIDANPDDHPNYPMKKYTGDDHDRLNWERPEQQPHTVEILHSNERPSLTAVYGTTAPPSGLSGLIRRKAFEKSESEYGHWLPLLFADRVNVIEGIIDDLKRGHIPNIFAEKGWNAEWKYNKKGMIKRLLVTAAVTTAVIMLMSKNKKKKKHLAKR